VVRNYYQSLCPYCGKHRNGPHRSQGCRMTEAMWAALVEWKKEHGRFWRARLRQAWLLDEQTSSEIRQVRNVVGPSGLDKIKLP
jgi:hypothetical protein